MASSNSLAQASVIARFEYVSLPINIMWGFLIWQEVPTLMTLAGALLTLASGLYVMYREHQETTLPESEEGHSPLIVNSF